MSDDSDLGRTRHFVESGLVKPEHVHECLKLQAEIASRGGPPPRILDLLVEKGYLSADALYESPTVPSASSSKSASAPDRYVKTEKLGSGGMGEVWRARDTTLNRWVALKFLKGDDPEELARFRREAHIVAKLNHPGIAQIHEIGESAGRPYISMQYIEGRTLSKVPRGDPRHLTRLVRDAARAVQFAQEQGVIHRDLKPDNIMLEDASGRVYVMDFGLAKQADTLSSLSAAGSAFGTPSYMPPEQAEGKTWLVGPASDVYSLGATLYELLGDRPPFKGASTLEIFRKIVDEEPPPLRNVDPDLWTVVAKCMEKEPKRRYANAKSLADEIDRWLKGEAIEAHAPSTLYRLRKYAGRRKAVVAVAAVAIVAIAAAALYFWNHRREARAWEAEARTLAGQGRYEEAKALLDRAKARVGVDETLYRECEARLAEQRAGADAKRIEDEIFGPIHEKLRTLPATPEGRRRGVELLDEGLARRADSWSAWMRKADLLRELGDASGAFDAYGRAVAINPKLGTARYRRGVLLMDWFDKKEDARKEFEAGEAADPGNELVAVGRARLAVLAQNFPHAVELCDEAEPSGRHLADLYYIRGYSKVMTGDRAAAIRDFTRALELEPTNYASRSNRGACYYVLGRMDEAIADYEAVLAVRPDYQDAWFNLGAARQKKGEHEEAIRAYARAGTPEAWAARSLSLLALGRVEEAIVDCTKSIEVRPTAEAYFRRGEAHRYARQHRDAVADYDRAIALNPDFAEAYNNRANAKQGLGQYEEAIRDHTKAVQLKPIPEGYAGRAECLVKLSQTDAARSREYLESALKDLEKALEVAPKDWRYGEMARSWIDEIRTALRKP